MFYTSMGNIPWGNIPGWNFPGGILRGGNCLESTEQRRRFSAGSEGTVGSVSRHIHAADDQETDKSGRIHRGLQVQDKEKNN